jgi:hypothetical protein
MLAIEVERGAVLFARYTLRPKKELLLKQCVFGVRRNG